MVRTNKKDYTTISVNKITKNKFKEFKKYPRETDEDTLLRLMKKEINKK